MYYFYTRCSISCYLEVYQNHSIAKVIFVKKKRTKLLFYVQRIDQFLYIKIQPKTVIDLGIRLWGITTEAEF